MKTYLNQRETFDLLKLIKISSDMEVMVEEWSGRNNLTVEEGRKLRTVVTMLIHAWESILKRMDNASIEKVVKRGKDMELFFIDKFQEKQLLKRLQESTDKLYQDNYYNLVELSIYYNCVNCTKSATECKYYELYCENCVPEPSGEEYEGKRCRFGYEDKGRLNE